MACRSASFPVVVPVDAVVAIYARENGQGMAFEALPASADGEETKVSPDETATGGNDDLPPPDGTRRNSHLTLVK